jgi:uncharacterized protein (DUF1015 family)
MMSLVDVDRGGFLALPEHRLVRGVRDFNAGMVLAGVSPLFEIKHIKEASGLEQLLSGPGRKIGFYCGEGGLFLLVLRDDGDVSRALTDKSDAFCSLDAAMLNTFIMEPILGSGQNPDISYTCDMHDALRAVDEGSAQCAFLINAADIGQVHSVSLAGERIPYRAARFYPKPAPGLLINGAL